MNRRVLVIGPVPPPVHGAAGVTAMVLEGLRSAGATVTSVDTSGPDDAPRPIFHTARLAIHVRAAALALLWHRRSVSVYVTGSGGHGLWYQVLLVAAGRVAGHRVVFHHHSYAHAAAPSVTMRVLTRIGGRTMVHVALCEGMASALRATYPTITEVRVCSNAGLFAPLDPVQPEVDRPRADGDATLVLGHLGNMSVAKGLPVVLDTFRRLQADGVSCRLLLAGPVQAGEAADLLAAAQAEYGPAIDHLGPIRPETVDTFYRRLDVFLFPSRYQHEAEPMVVLEASRCGVPTLAFEIGCLGALVHDQDWLVAPSGDFPAAAAKVAARLTDATQRGADRQAVLAHFATRQQAAALAHERLRDSLMGVRA